VRGTGKSIDLIGYPSHPTRSPVLPRTYDTDSSHAADVTSLDELLAAPAAISVAP